MKGFASLSASIGLSWALTLICGCSSPVVLNQDSTSPQTFVVGDRFDLELSENASTGFSWSLDDFDDQVLSLVADELDVGSTEPGAAATRIFSFECVGAGATEIAGHLERGDEEGDSFSIDVTCQ